MASAWYPEGLRALMNKEIDLDTDSIRVRAVADEDYTYSAAHLVMTSVTKYVASTDYVLTGLDISTTKGTLDAADASPAYSSLAQDTTKDIDGLVVYKFTTADADSIPLIYIDLTTPVTPNGGDINISWNASGIASL